MVTITSKMSMPPQAGNQHPPAPNRSEGKKGITPKGATAQTNSQDYSREQIGEIIEKINTTIKISGRYLDFRFDYETEELVTSVIDVETGEEIRMIPTESVIDFSRSWNQFVGMIINDKV